jgi:maleylacetoacetate isomerase
MARPILYDYFRSSAAYRVRIALNLKRVDYESRQVDLRDNQQKSADYRALNPQGLVPMLEIDGLKLSQSMAILTYLDLRYPNQPLIPASADARAHVIAMCQVVVADIHPLNNLRVLKYLKNELGQPQEAIDAWYRHWIGEGLPALEALAAQRAGKFLFGNGPTAADVCLIPQLYNARRYDAPLDGFPTLLHAEENANKLEAFAAATPERQEVVA